MLSRWLFSRWSRAGLFVILAAALGFLCTLAVSAQRSARMHAAMGLAIESEKPGSAALSDDMSDVASDDDDRDADEAAPPRDLETLLTGAEAASVRPVRIASIEPEAPDLASEDDPP